MEIGTTVYRSRLRSVFDDKFDDFLSWILRSLEYSNLRGNVVVRGKVFSEEDLRCGFGGRGINLRTADIEYVRDVVWELRPSPVFDRWGMRIVRDNGSVQVRYNSRNVLFPRRWLTGADTHHSVVINRFYDEGGVEDSVRRIPKKYDSVRISWQTAVI